MPGIHRQDEKQPIITYSKRTNRVSWVSESDFGTDDELALKRGNRLARLAKYNQRCSKYHKKRIVAVVIIPIFLLIVFGLVYLYYADAKAAVSPTEPVPLTSVAQTDCGNVKGSIELSPDSNKTALVFKGIPYAAAPVKKLRWKAPVDLRSHNACWKGVLPALSFGSSCPQYVGNTTEVIGSEDCLFLNVWTPSLTPTTLLPVVVFIHGGGLMHFSGATRNYLPTVEMVTSLNIVAVSFNYRLNVFGFLSLHCLSAMSKSNSSGNFGFMDQAFAIEWVHRNIINFGGDPKRVSLLGHEAGATSAVVMHQSPLTRNRGLFQRIIAVSGPTPIKKTYVKASAENSVFIKNSNCSNVSVEEVCNCIFNLTVSSILRASPWQNSVGKLSTGRHFDFPEKGVIEFTLAVLEPVTLPHFTPYIESTDSVQIMIGNTAQEIDLKPFLVFQDGDYKKFSEHMNSTLGSFSPIIAEEGLSLYNMTTHLSNQLLYETMTSDIRLACFVNWFASELASGLGKNVYRYIVESKPSAPVYNQWYNFAARNAFSTWDVHALFGLRSLKSSGFIPAEEDLGFSALFRSQLLHFMKFGHPLETSWQLFPTSTAIFKSRSITFDANQTALFKSKCQLWKDYGLLDYAWMF